MEESLVREKMQVYDALCLAADSTMLAWGDVCCVRDGACLRGTTCCQRCELLVDGEGCRTKNLLCKFWFCEIIKKAHPTLAEVMRCLKYKAEDVLPGLAYHISKEEYETSLRGRQSS